MFCDAVNKFLSKSRFEPKADHNFDTGWEITYEALITLRIETLTLRGFKKCHIFILGPILTTKSYKLKILTIKSNS